MNILNVAHVLLHSDEEASLCPSRGAAARRHPGSKRECHMRYSARDLEGAANAGVISATDLERLLGFLSASAAGSDDGPAKFDAAHLLWYAGALIVIGAMGLFSTVAFSQMGGGALTACAIAYAIGFTAAGHHLWHRRQLRVPGGLLIAVAVSMAPLAVF